MRKKALVQADFPSGDIIKEFLSQLELSKELDLNWKQPNIVKFVVSIILKFDVTPGTVKH